MSQNIVHPETQCSCWGGRSSTRSCRRRAGSLRKDVVSQQVYVHCLLMAWGQGRATRSCFYSHTTARYAGCVGTRAPRGCAGGRTHLWEDQVTPLWSGCHLLFNGRQWHCHRSQTPMLQRCCGGAWRHLLRVSTMWVLWWSLETPKAAPQFCLLLSQLAQCRGPCPEHPMPLL